MCHRSHIYIFLKSQYAVGSLGRRRRPSIEVKSADYHVYPYQMHAGNIQIVCVVGPHYKGLRMGGAIYIYIYID